MTQKDLIKNLRQLRSIEPNEEFARVSRSVILSSKDSIPVERTGKLNVFSRGLSFAASVALAAVFLLVLAVGGTTGSLKTLFLPTLDGVDENLVSEADTIKQDIDIRLNDIEYFEKTNRTVALADNNQHELFEGEEEIDQLLEEVISY